MHPRYKVDFESLPWNEPGDGIRFKIMQRDGYQVRLVEFSRHMKHESWCVRGHMAYIVEGRMEIDFDGKRECFEVGDGLFVPDGEAHRHRPKVLSDRVVFFSVERI
jgi:mannose-6-phosphate isomerase-like protein (cupin superfamily)